MTDEEKKELKIARAEMGFDDDSQDIINGPKKQEKEDAEEDERLIDLTPEMGKEKIDEEDEVDEEEDEEDETIKDSRPQTKGIPAKQFNQLRTQLREQREARELAEKELLEFKTAKEREELSKVDDDTLLATAKELLPPDATEEQIKATEFQLKKILALTGRTNQTEQFAKLQEKIEVMESEKLFNSEWEDFSHDLKSSFPQATSKQLREAKAAMDELSHSDKFADKEMDYILYKNKDIFNDILISRKSKTFDSKDNYIPPEKENNEIDETTPAHKLSPEKLAKRVAKREAEARRQDDEDGWNITNPD